MKFIVKQPEPSEFREWKEMANANWQPAYKDLSGDPKIKLHESLLKEQGHICCYCNRRIDDKDSHIEHLIPQHQDKDKELDYNNLLASCQRKTEPKEPRHCGVMKGEWYDSSLMVSPLDNNCEKRFLFIEDGQIKSRDDNEHAAKETIRRLGLGIDKLKKMRQKAIEPVIEILPHVTQPDADSGPAVIPAKAGICEKRGFLLSQERQVRNMRYFVRINWIPMIFGNGLTV